MANLPKRRMYKPATDGIECAVCGCRDTRTIRTMKIASVIRRERQCRHCGHRFYTTESQ